MSASRKPTTLNALFTLITLAGGEGRRELNADLVRLGFEPATLKDLAQIGGWENALGVWGISSDKRSCTLETRIARGMALEAHSHKFHSLGYTVWQEQRNTMVLRWIRQDARV